MLRSAIGVWFAAALLTGLAAGQVADELRLADEPSSAAPAKPPKPELKKDGGDDKEKKKDDGDGEKKDKKNDEKDDEKKPFGPPKTLFSWSLLPPDPSKKDEEDSSPFSKPLESDRPDFTEASSTVGQGVWQLETGYTYTRASGFGQTAKNQNYPQALLRYGAWADWLELRLGWSWNNECVAEGAPHTQQRRRRPLLRLQTRLGGAGPLPPRTGAHPSGDGPYRSRSLHREPHVAGAESLLRLGIQRLLHRRRQRLRQRRRRRLEPRVR